MAASTATRVASFTLPARLITRETVMVETPAARATSLIVGAPARLREVGFVFFFTLRTTGTCLLRPCWLPGPRGSLPARGPWRSRQRLLDAVQRAIGRQHLRHAGVGL